MHKVHEIVCMSTSLNILRYYQAFPKKGTELNPGIGFYLKFILMCLLASVLLIGSVLHLNNTIRTGVVAFTVMETIEHIILRLDHVKYLLGKALKEENRHIRRKLFNFAVNYHIRVLQ
ncbi:hypothetical protein NQ314_016104 [Rhamnusium bicolor]|uniref:Uncharacterized protein n=1 Tax=Rhamnusium bicolor TaxID=1586634 RepID=A0AAV8WWT7_9CUCU|nr:hypothetical protein NQ314_016104 [Rhamnusium bicolor]